MILISRLIKLKFTYHLFNLITGLIIGFIIGFVLSMPPLGPTNFAIISKGFKNEINEGVAIGTGAGFMDFIYIMVAYGGVSIIRSLLPESVDVFFEKNENSIKIFLTLLGWIIVVFYGFKIMKMKVLNGNGDNNQVTGEKLNEKFQEKAENKLIKTEKGLDKLLHMQALEKEKTGLTGDFLTGVLLCLSSVTLPASWFAIVGYLKSYGIIDSTFFSGFGLAVGVLLGTAVWFWTLVKFISKNAYRISPKMLNKINIGVGTFLILLGVFLLSKAVEFAFFKV